MLIALTFSPTIAVQAVVLLVILGIVWYFLGPKIAEPFNSMIIVVVVLIFCLWLLHAFGII